MGPARELCWVQHCNCRSGREFDGVGPVAIRQELRRHVRMTRAIVPQMRHRGVVASSTSAHRLHIRFPADALNGVLRRRGGPVGRPGLVHARHSPKLVATVRAISSKYRGAARAAAYQRSA
jgi:hypothetical protein